ncbi:hypothetical protein Y032_0540g3170 [Ancylostoma ceylanicum]|uniref:Uncharacterized protein n=1 Tax=Ancylostoma ceylanicum TaxID=53326 RepID=A0A016WRH5_9BILA|nr:hypothetical protein Y032_0540g3170 [Ancylostoma ceylanicum]
MMLTHVFEVELWKLQPKQRGWVWRTIYIGHSKRSEYWRMHRLKANGAVVHYQTCSILMENDSVSVRVPLLTTDWVGYTRPFYC